MDSPEYKTLTQCYPKLVACVTLSPNDVAVQLRPSEILAPGDLAFLKNPYNSNDQKAERIIDSVMQQVQINPEIFYMFVSALKASGPWIKTIVRELEHTHTSLSAPTNMQSRIPLVVDSSNTSTLENSTRQVTQISPRSEPNSQAVRNLDQALDGRQHYAGSAATSVAAHSLGPSGCKHSRSKVVCGDSEIEQEDLAYLAGYFDSVECYLNAMRLAPHEKVDVRRAVSECGNCIGMERCLEYWREHDHSAATFNALIKMVRRLKKEAIAEKVCEYLVSKQREQTDML